MARASTGGASVFIPDGGDLDVPSGVTVVTPADLGITEEQATEEVLAAEEPVAAEPAAAEAAPPEPPSTGATKSDWVDYAVALGMDQAQANSMTKYDLIAATKEQTSAGSSS